MPLRYSSTPPPLSSGQTARLHYNRFFDIEPGISPDFDIDIKDVQTVFGRNGSTCANPIPPQPPLTTIPDP